MLASAEAEDKFWAYAMHQVAYIHNRVITARFHNNPVGKFKTPIELLESLKPDLSKIVGWGMLVEFLIPKHLGNWNGEGGPVLL